MTTFHLTVVTPDGCAFEGQAERIVCRAIDGDIAILAKHGDYCTALGMGEAHIVDADGQRRRAACMGYMSKFCACYLSKILTREVACGPHA